MANVDSGRTQKAQWEQGTGVSGQKDENGILITALGNNKKHYLHEEQGKTVHVTFRKIVH